MQKKITVKFLFAAAQILIAFSGLILAALINFNLFNTQSFLKIPNDALNFYVVMLVLFGLFFLISGLFPIYDWWEN